MENAIQGINKEVLIKNFLSLSKKLVFLQRRFAEVATGASGGKCSALPSFLTRQSKRQDI